MKKEDQRIKVTKILIKEALSKLLQEKGFDKISIKELCELAGINRGTFYSHYKDLNELQNKIYDEFIDSFQNAFLPSLNNANVSTLTSEEMIFSILTFLEQNKDLCIIMLHSTKRDQFIGQLAEIGKNIVTVIYPKVLKIENMGDIELFYHFVSGGSIEILIQWISQGCDTKSNILATKLNKLIKSALSYFSM